MYEYNNCHVLAFLHVRLAWQSLNHHCPVLYCKMHCKMCSWAYLELMDFKKNKLLDFQFRLLVFVKAYNSTIL